ncbi:MAG: DUF5394 family protein [Pseudomonadota bacterium]
MIHSKNQSSKDLRSMDISSVDTSSINNDTKNKESWSKSSDAEDLEFLALLESDEEFTKGIDELLADLDSANPNLEAIQSKIILLIKKYLFREGNSKDHSILDQIFKSSEEKVVRLVRDLSAYIIIRKSQKFSEEKQNDILEHFYDDGLAANNSRSMQDIKAAMKRFMIYEIYKIMTPYRIAGATKKEKFISNAIVHGVKVAMKHDGGTKQEIEKYDSDLVNALHKSVRALKRKSISLGLGR